MECSHRIGRADEPGEVGVTASPARLRRTGIAAPLTSDERAIEQGGKRGPIGARGELGFGCQAR